MDEAEINAIDAAIDAASAEAEAPTAEEAPAEPTGEEPKAAPADGGEEQPQKEGDGGEEAPSRFLPKDELIERGVRAGLSLREIMDIGSDEAMEGILKKMGAAAPDDKDKPASGDGNPAGGGDGGEGNPLAEIPELSIDDGYDEGLVAAFNGLRRLAIKQSETIDKLARAGEAAHANDRFGKLLGTLDPDVQYGMDADAISKLRKQFDVLSAGYKATGTEMKDADVFKEAAKLALGDRLAETAGAKRAEALEKRKNLAMAKPGGEGGAGARKPTYGDGEYDDIIAGLQQKGLV